MTEPTAQASPAPEKPKASYYFSRFGAALLDMLVMGCLFYFIGMVVAVGVGGALSPYSFNIEGAPALKLFALVALTGFGYYWLMEGLFGRTLGKMIFGLKVVGGDGKSCGLVASLIRNLLRMIDYLFFFMVGIVTILVTKHQQRVGDMAAKTQVVLAPSGALRVLGIFMFIAIGSGSIVGSKAYYMKASGSHPGGSSSTSSTPPATTTPTTTSPAGNESGPGPFIRNARFTDGEKGPTLSKPYLPGGELYLTFDLAQVPLDSAGKANATIQFEAGDSQGRLLLEPTIINLDSGPPDGSTNKLPVYYHLTMPTYVTGGTYRILITIQDKVKGLHASQEVPFTVDGPQVPALSSLSAMDFNFFDAGGQAVPNSTYSAGSTVQTKFKVVGFKMGVGNEVAVRLDMGVESESGERLLDKPNIVSAQEKFFYPPTFLPMSTTLNTPPGITPGKYILRFVLHDDVAGTQANFDQPFIVQ